MPVFAVKSKTNSTELHDKFKNVKSLKPGKYKRYLNEKQLSIPELVHLRLL